MPTLTGKTIPKVSLFKTGEHPGQNASGITFTDADLDAMVQSFNDLQLAGRVPLKFGHNDAQPFTDGQPALGWVQKVWREGGKLFGTLSDIPTVIYSMIQKGLYKFTSIELLKDATQDGKSFPWVLDAVALLGAEPPAVSGLDDLQKLTLSRESFKFAAVLSFRDASDVRQELPADDPAAADPAATQPTPAATDNQDDFMTACMANRYMNAQFPTQTTRSQACYRIWQEEGPPAKGGGQGAPPALEQARAQLVETSGKLAATEQQAAKYKADLARITAENAQLKKDVDAAAKKERAEKVKLARDAVKELLEAAVRDKLILPAQRLMFSKMLQVDNDDAVLALQISDVEKLCGLNLTDARRVMMSRRATNRDPADLTCTEDDGTGSITHFAENHAEKVMTFARENGYGSDTFSAWPAYLRRHPTEGRAFLHHCFEPGQ